MALTENAKKVHEKLLSDHHSTFMEYDTEFIERFENFAFDEVLKESSLDDKTRMMAVLATLIGSQAVDTFAVMAEGAYNIGVTPIELKEIIYQAVAYLGYGRVLPFLRTANTIFLKHGVQLPLEGQATTTLEDRLQKGEQAQVDIFGESMRGFSESGPKETRHINRWLSANCFGDYYTRKGLDYKQREMITFCFLFAQGGCEPQLISHAAANMKIGNDKDFLIQIVSQCLPYIGYPRSLNALRCIEEAAKNNK